MKTLIKLLIFKSNKHIYSQLINSLFEQTIITSSTLNLKLNNIKKNIAFQVGENLAKKALQNKIFFSNINLKNYKYHGRIKSLILGARKYGLYC